MDDGQWDLDGFLFGVGTAIEVRDFDPGGVVINDQDAEYPTADGRLMGRDTEDGPEWTFELAVHTTPGQPTYDLYAALKAAWRARAKTSTPGVILPLRYALPGRERVVYGRPRRFQPLRGALHNGWHHGYLPVACTFQLADPIVYDAAERELTLRFLEPTDGGVVLPAALPWILGTAPNERQGIVTVGGDTPVPFTLTFHGPVTGRATAFWASGAGWRVDLNASLGVGQTITVDTRAGTIIRSDGLRLAGAASGRFLNARLRPGNQEIRFGATDPTNTSSLRVAWRDGHHF